MAGYPRLFRVNVGSLLMTIKLTTKWNSTYLCMFEKDELINPYNLYGVFGFAITFMHTKNKNYSFYYAIQTKRKNMLPYSVMENIWKQIHMQLYN